VWVLGQQSGIDGAAALLVLLVALSALLWALGQQGRARRVLTTVTALLLLLAVTTLAPSIVSPGVTASRVASADDPWQPWQPGRVETLVGAGHPVFVDFTAAWCVTCQFNKKTTLSDPQVLADMQQRQVQMLRADWTRRDPDIAAALARLGRSGVPVYVLYQAGRPPLILSELPSKAEVHAALAAL